MCKLRYRTQEEFLAAAREFKRLGLPLSVLVIDFRHWRHWGDWQLDPEFWPDPAAMVRELDELGARIMISPWVMVEESSENFAELHRRGLYVKGPWRHRGVVAGRPAGNEAAASRRPPARAHAAVRPHPPRRRAVPVATLEAQLRGPGHQDVLARPVRRPQPDRGLRQGALPRRPGRRGQLLLPGGAPEERVRRPARGRRSGGGDHLPQLLGRLAALRRLAGGARHRLVVRPSARIPDGGAEPGHGGDSLGRGGDRRLRHAGGAGRRVPRAGGALVPVRGVHAGLPHPRLPRQQRAVEHRRRHLPPHPRRHHAAANGCAPTCWRR